MTTSDSASWTASFANTSTEDLVTSSCLMYADLSTWDLRDMSYANTGDAAGYYYDVVEGNKIYFNPCRQLNFGVDVTYTTLPNSSLSFIADEVEYASFAVFRDGSDFYPLNKEDQWLADTTDALYPVDEEGNVTSKDNADGIQVIYDSGIVC
jgi:hypothetical protein